MGRRGVMWYVMSRCVEGVREGRRGEVRRRKKQAVAAAILSRFGDAIRSFAEYV